MGEFADMAIAESLDSYWDDEWDEDGPPMWRRRRRAPYRVCRYCGQTHLFWGKIRGQWRLFGRVDGTITPHTCDSRSKPDRAETVKQGSVHESGGAGTAIAQPPSPITDPSHD